MRKNGKDNGGLNFKRKERDMDTQEKFCIYGFDK
jgi:hypothetical protein